MCKDSVFAGKHDITYKGRKRYVQNIRIFVTNKLPHEEYETRHKTHAVGKRPALPADRTIKNVMDRYYLDPLVGLFFPTAGDIFSSAMTLPFLTVSLFKIKSIPLTLAILYNMLVDMMLGIIPLWIGDLLDIFSRSYAKNYRLIVGFVEGDKEVIQEVNRKAVLTAANILVLCVIIYWVAKLAVYLTTALWTWISGLF